MPKEKITFDRINNNANGNPRYVCHYLNLLTQAECNNSELIGQKYDIALNRARKIGGKKFHNKQYGGGIAFVSFNLDETEAAINRVIAEAEAKENA